MRSSVNPGLGFFAIERGVNGHSDMAADVSG